MHVINEPSPFRSNKETVRCAPHEEVIFLCPVVSLKRLKNSYWIDPADQNGCPNMNSYLQVAQNCLIILTYLHAQLLMFIQRTERGMYEGFTQISGSWLKLVISSVSELQWLNVSMSCVSLDSGALQANASKVRARPHCTRRRHRGQSFAR